METLNRKDWPRVTMNIVVDGVSMTVGMDVDSPDEPGEIPAEAWWVSAVHFCGAWWPRDIFTMGDALELDAALHKAIKKERDAVLSNSLA